MMLIPNVRISLLYIINILTFIITAVTEGRLSIREKEVSVSVHNRTDTHHSGGTPFGTPSGFTLVQDSVNSLYFMYKYDPSTSTNTFAFPSAVSCRILQEEEHSVHDSCTDIHEYRRFIASTRGLFATYLAIKDAFLKDAGTITPQQVNHYFSAGTLCFSRGSCRYAHEISAGIRTTSGMLEVAIITYAIVIVLDRF